MLRLHHSTDSDHRSANWGHSEVGVQSGRKNQPACFFTCHRGAGASGGGEYRSVSKLGSLIDIRIATSRWPFLLCCKLGHVSVPSRLITMHTSPTAAAVVTKSADRTSSSRYKITLPRLRYSLKP